MNWHNILDHRFKKDFINKWQTLLDANHTENYYQNFLSKNAGLFLGNENCHLVISKLKLGSELETDFVTLTDGFSNGNQFELIEIKRPNSKLFTKKGLISSDLNRAGQQIRDWKRWLIENKAWFHKYLPTTSTRVISESYLNFKIIIGRRSSNPYEIEKRNQIGKEIGAEIRSFDYLTDKFKTRTFYPRSWLESGDQFLESELANPFYQAMSDSEWKKICNSKKLSTFHFYSLHTKQILDNRRYNKGYSNIYHNE
ncbi:Shedu anti-phage system protein SduA domain-containing protein [Autumnicola musiva]|uniref:DUF4263 domain-containing protein n=1 Tax=Autumnicola musiva TaxID=3075589 RepID=A0ABU3D4K5_9FLAO|nr:Shedu anti-phage system protein SduA domain-containing protein [Zunongwangia sp. F117]MDT0676469.1 DUF4263 domain-containing protein [Zunongwangia sp. F117]